MSSWVSICCNESRITPTMISRDVPPKKEAKPWVMSSRCAKPGKIPTIASRQAPGNVIHDGTDIVGRRLTRFYAGDKPVIPLQIVGDLLGIKYQGRIQEGKPDHDH